MLNILNGLAFFLSPSIVNEKMGDISLQKKKDPPPKKKPNKTHKKKKQEEALISR